MQNYIMQKFISIINDEGEVQTNHIKSSIDTIFKCWRGILKLKDYGSSVHQCCKSDVMYQYKSINYEHNIEYKNVFENL